MGGNNILGLQQDGHRQAEEPGKGEAGFFHNGQTKAI
jgi:hypothetical protein